jgi:hypothetical protein
VSRPLFAAVALILAFPLLGGCASQPAPANPPIVTTKASAPGTSTSWALTGDQSASATQAGLPMLGQEMLQVHYHAHIDLMVRGARVPIPVGVGIDTAQQKISPLHTHDTTGIVHIESGADIPFRLSQFFTEWGQPLDASRVGPVAVAEGEQLRVYRDGKQVPGDPASITFTPARRALSLGWPRG